MFQYDSVHKHVCLFCDRTWDCEKYDCEGDTEHISFLTCEPCARAAAQVHPSPASMRGGDEGIHMHVCPKCNRGWDCSNECGAEAEEMITTMRCGYCMPPFAQQTLPVSAVDEVTQEMPHSHICMVGNHRWIHKDAECGFEAMMHPADMKHLECPACFIFTRPCPQCGHDAWEEVLLARSDKERAFWCEPCNTVFRCDIGQQN